MNGIDISAWQGDAGIDLAKVPYDFCIVKATEGTNYKNRYFASHCDKVLNRKKLLGVYHYANGGDPHSEAEYFIAYSKKYIGKAILVLDWEAKNNHLFGVKDLEWCLKWCNYVQKKTGIKPIIYVQKSAMDAVKKAGYGLWVQIAMRPDTRSTHGMRELTTALYVSTHLSVSSQVTAAALISIRLISVQRAGISWPVRSRPHLHPRQQRRASIHWLKRC